MDELKKENDTQKLENTKVNESLEKLTTFMNAQIAAQTINVTPETQIAAQTPNVTPETTQTPQTQTEDIISET